MRFIKIVCFLLGHKFEKIMGIVPDSQRFDYSRSCDSCDTNDCEVCRIMDSNATWENRRRWLNSKLHCKCKRCKDYYFSK